MWTDSKKDHQHSKTHVVRQFPANARVHRPWHNQTTNTRRNPSWYDGYQIVQISSKLMLIYNTCCLHIVDKYSDCMCIDIWHGTQRISYRSNRLHCKHLRQTQWIESCMQFFKLCFLVIVFAGTLTARSSWLDSNNHKLVDIAWPIRLNRVGKKIEHICTHPRDIASQRI
jgi:hypothetical protein